jgi:hypothetical protein
LRLISLATVLVFSVSAVGTPFAAALSTDQEAGRTTATVTTQASIFIRPVATIPLWVASVGTALNVRQEQGDWTEVEFKDPQIGMRVGWVQTSLIRISRPGRQPMDLSVNSDDPVAAVPSKSAALAPRKPIDSPEPVNAVPTGKDTTAAGMIDGEALAESTRTGGKLGAGLGIGVLTGLIGTGIGYFVVGPARMTPEALERYSNKNPEYQMGFKSAWEKKSQSKKRNAFLVGGLLGTAAFVVVLVSAQGSSQ